MNGDNNGRPVALFVPTLRAGGAERVAVNLASGISRRGVPTHLVVATATGSFLSQVPDTVRVVDLGATRVLGSLRAFARYLRRERPAAIISFMNHANVAALLARGLSGVSPRVIATVHSMLSVESRTSRKLGDRLMPLVLRVCYPWADEIVAVSGGVAADLAQVTKLPAGRIRVIYNPVIAAGFGAPDHGAPPHPWLAPGAPPVVLGVGRLTYPKNFPLLIRAFARLRATRPARLLILGEGEDRPALEALVREGGLEADVALPGFVADIHRYMARAGVFVLSSTREGLPTVLIEALALGVPVVATDCPSGPREILRGGELGRLVPSGDEAALADAMRAALDGAGVRVPPDALREFTFEAAADAYLRLVGTEVH